MNLSYSDCIFVGVHLGKFSTEALGRFFFTPKRLRVPFSVNDLGTIIHSLIFGYAPYIDVLYIYTNCLAKHMLILQHELINTYFPPPTAAQKKSKGDPSGSKCLPDQWTLSLHHLGAPMNRFMWKILRWIGVFRMTRQAKLRGETTTAKGDFFLVSYDSKDLPRWMWWFFVDVICFPSEKRRFYPQIN